MTILHESTAGLTCPRQQQGALTSRFAETWPAVERPLRAYVSYLGARADQVDEVVQETATRALESGVPYDDAAHLRQWCFVVARRIWIDDLRGSRRTTDLQQAASLLDAQADDAMRRVEDRHLLSQVAEVLPLLRAADRAALAALPEGALTSAAERNRRNVARHRARSRLRAMVGPFGVLAGWSLPSWLKRAAPSTSGVATVALPTLVALVSVQLGPATPAPAAERTTVAAGVLASADLPPRGDKVTMPSGGTPASPTTASASEDSAAAPPGTPALAVGAPGQAHLGVASSDRRPDDQLLCLRGDVGSACLDLPAVLPVPEPVTGSVAVTTGAVEPVSATSR